MAKHIKTSGAIGGHFYIAPDSYFNAFNYLGGGDVVSKIGSGAIENNPLSFKNTLEQAKPCFTSNKPNARFFKFAKFIGNQKES